MGKKLTKDVYPQGHTEKDFKCFGPVATKDGEFTGCKLADMGCFKQDKVDSNKFYHLCVCQSLITSTWYTYFSWGRVGKAITFQMIECTSEKDAQNEFEKQAHAKNDKRGKWENVAGIKTLVPKPGKDVYLVQANDSRNWGLPDAKNIATASKPLKVKQAAKKSVKSSIQPEVLSLLNDINVATIEYTRTQIKGEYLPSQQAIDEARDILNAAMTRIMFVGHSTQDQVNDSQLKLLTNTLYSRIPKVKSLRAKPEEWILNQRNIDDWKLELDAFASALGAAEVVKCNNEDVYGGMPITLEWIGSSKKPITAMAEWLTNWMPKATRNKHSYINEVNLLNIWEINRKGASETFSKEQNSILNQRIPLSERPLFQESSRPDLNEEQRKNYSLSNTALLFHGTRSVNVRGILDTSLKLPNQLVGVTTNAALLGQGIYMADDFKKSVGYTSHPKAVYVRGSGAIKNRKWFMFLGDVCLGRSFIAKSPYGYTKAPDGHHSVFGKAGVTKCSFGTLKNNEFVVYKASQNNLRYLVEFDI